MDDRLRSGLPGLDNLLGGGLDRGTATLLLGPSGAGKSSVASRFAVSAAARGEKVAMYIFDERPSTLLMRSEGLGIGLATHIDNGTLAIQSVDAAEMSPGEFTHNVRQRVEVDQARLVIIDSLAGYIHAMPGAHALILHLRELLTYLGNRGVTTLMVVTQHGMLGSAMQGDIDVSYLADNVLLFRYYEFAGEVRKALSVFKRRGGIHDNAICELKLGPPDGVTLGPALADFCGVMTGVPIYAKATAHVSGSKLDEA
jgi:circadian clock protein KaiC